MAFPKQVTIVEVSPRDGLQNEARLLPADVKIDFINRLSATGLPVIEVTSFVSAKWIPQLADNQDVYQRIQKKPGVRYPVLVPNLTGLDQALVAGVTEIAVFTTPSEQFSRHNTHCSVAESMQRVAAVLEVAKKKALRVRAYVSCVLGCPYEGEMTPRKVAAQASALYAMGCDEISLGDTIGVGTPLNTRALIETVAAAVPIQQLAVHFHDTYGQALVNIYEALALGVAVIDSSVAGIGGCPYAKGASGNVATEDVVYLLNGMGIATGVDLNQLVAVGRFISTQFQREPLSRVNQAVFSSHVES